MRIEAQRRENPVPAGVVFFFAALRLGASHLCSVGLGATLLTMFADPPHVAFLNLINNVPRVIHSTIARPSIDT